jgi:hypothetical protein
LPGSIPEENDMKGWGWLFAVVPFVVSDASTTARAPQPGAVAIAVDIRAPVGWGTVEWHLLTRQPEPGWAIYAVTFCSLDGQDGCDGMEIRVRVAMGEVWTSKFDTFASCRPWPPSAASLPRRCD